MLQWGTKRLFFLCPLWHTPLDITPTPLEISLTPLFLARCLHWWNLSTRNIRGVMDLRKARRQGAGKLWNFTIKGSKRFWDYNNKLWRWSLGSEVEEQLLESYWTNLEVPHIETNSHWNLTRINGWNRISLDLGHLNNTSNLPNNSVRNKVTVFPLPLWHTPWT